MNEKREQKELEREVQMQPWAFRLEKQPYVKEISNGLRWWRFVVSDDKLPFRKLSLSYTVEP